MANNGSGDDGLGNAVYILIVVFACVLFGIYLVSRGVLPFKEAVEEPKNEYYSVLEASIGERRDGSVYTLAAVEIENRIVEVNISYSEIDSKVEDLVGSCLYGFLGNQTTAQHFEVVPCPEQIERQKEKLE